MENYVETTLSENEIKDLLGLRKQTFFEIVKKIIKYILIFIAIFLVIFSIINAPAIGQKLKYFWKVDYKDESFADISTPISSTNNQVQLPNINTVPSQPTQVSLNDLQLDNNTLYIPKINIKAPIIWQSSEQDILENLKKGVVHYKGTALPGQGGNVFITGHSSNYWWIKAPYNHVFALLEKLVVGDTIVVNYNNVKYAYKVNNVIVVKPTQLSVMDPTSKPILSLMTCVPVGTTINRLVVQADQTWPSSSSTGTQTPNIDLPFLMP